MLTRLLEKYKEIEASAQNTNIKNDKLDILTQILLLDKLLENVKNENEQLLTFFSNESIFIEIERFCFGFIYDFSFSTDLAQQNQNEIRNLLSLKCLEVLINIPSSFYSDILPSSLKFNDICSNLLLHNIKCYIMKTCNEIINNNIEYNNNNIKFLDTHFFGFFSQVIFKIMKWNIPIFFMPDIYKQKITERNKKYNINNENCIQLEQNSQIINDQIQIQIDDNIDITKIINDLNHIIDKFGLYLILKATHDQQKSKTYITISQNITDSFFPNFKYISNLIIYNIHNNYAMQEFLIDILKSYPEALPDGAIVKRLSQIACDNFTGINLNENANNNNNNEISCKDTENNTKNPNQTDNCGNDCCNSTSQFDFNSTFNQLKNYFCDRYDACYTLVDIYRSLPTESPIFYQYLDSTVLNNIIKAASLIYEEEKNSTNSFKHTALTVGLIEIVTKMVNNNSKLLASINLPSNLIISEENVNEVTISSIELYLKIEALKSTETSKTRSSSSKPPNIQLNRRASSSHHSFNSNTENITMIPSQIHSLTKSRSESKNIDNTKYQTECKLFKLFFTSEKLQNKLITLFFNNSNALKPSSTGNKNLIQSSSTNCINLYDSSNSFSFPTSNSTSNSFRYQTGVDCSYPRNATTGAWQNDKNDQSNENSFLAAIASVPGLIQGLESAYEKERLARFRLKPKRKNSSGINSSTESVTSSVPNFNLEGDISSSLERIAISTTSNESSMITSSSYDTLEGSNSSNTNLNAPKWTPACKFLALELTKLNDADISVPEINTRKWKSAVTPAIRRFNLILESTYGYNDSLISRHRSCSMNDKLQISQPFPSSPTNSTFYCPKPFNSSTFSMKYSSSSNNQLESRITSFEKVKFSSNFINLADEDDSIPIIHKTDNDNENYSANDADLPTPNLYNIDDDADDNMIEPIEIEINSDNFESDGLKKIGDCKSESHKNYPHSLNLQEKNCFSTLPANSISSYVPKSPNFSRYPVPALNLSTSTNSSSSDSSTSLSSIKMSTQQTIIQKKKDKKQKESQPPQTQPVSSSNSEGDDEYIIDI